MTIEEYIPLAPHTTFRLGGPARYFARIAALEDLAAAFAFAADKKLKVALLGGGSNVLFSDEGFDGLVLKLELLGVERLPAQGDGAELYIAAAGERWDSLVERAVEDGRWGIENLSGIPGSVGGAVVQNIGAYGAALSQSAAWVEAYDTHERAVVRFESVSCQFGYRSSLFKRAAGRYVVLRAAFALRAEGVPDLSYADLAALSEAERSLPAIRRAVLAIRAQKFPDLAAEGTAGSFFLNPIVSPAQAQALKARYPDLPLFAMPETDGIKVPLGWLLDRVLNLRGCALGEARLFERQALVVVASRKARASDVRALAEKIKNDVREKIGIEIVEEVSVL